jgi:hypothetical protein
MPLDAYNRFSDGQDISGNAATSENSTNVLDLDQAAGIDWKGTSRTPDPSSGGHNPIIEVKVTTAFVAAADGCVLTITLYEHTAATSIESGNIIAESDPITVNIAGQAIGTILWSFTIPFDKVTERYIGLHYARATQNLTTAAVDASIMWGREKQYP